MGYCLPLHLSLGWVWVLSLRKQYTRVYMGNNLAIMLIPFYRVWGKQLFIIRTNLIRSQITFSVNNLSLKSVPIKKKALYGGIERIGLQSKNIHRECDLIFNQISLDTFFVINGTRLAMFITFFSFKNSR